MKCVIISEEKLIDFGKKCLSNLRDFVNDEYCLKEFNDVKRLRTLFFLACQKVVGKKLELKENLYIDFFEVSNEVCNEKIQKIMKEIWNIEEEKKDEKIINEKLQEIINEVWNEELQEKFWEALMIAKKTEVEEETKVEEIFNTPVNEKYSRIKFSLEELYRIFDLIEDGIDKCIEIDDDIIFKIRDFKKIYYVYDCCYKSLDI